MIKSNDKVTYSVFTINGPKRVYKTFSEAAGAASGLTESSIISVTASSQDGQSVWTSSLYMVKGSTRRPMNQYAINAAAEYEKQRTGRI